MTACTPQTGCLLLSHRVGSNYNMTSLATEKTATKRPAVTTRLDSDAFLSRAQRVVLDNFNAHRKPDKVPELVLDDINVVWFAKVLGGWKCIISSTVAKGLLWEVTYASSRDELYLDVYTKLNNIKISLGEDKAP